MRSHSAGCRNIEQLQEACVHQVLQTVLPHTSVHVQIWSPHGKLLLDMPKVQWYTLNSA